MPADTRTRRPLGVIGAAWEICKKDARIELRTREVVATAGVFSIVVAVLASMAYLVKSEFNRVTAAGTIWIAVFFASVLSFGRIWQRERDESALTGESLPVDKSVLEGSYSQAFEGAEVMAAMLDHAHLKPSFPGYSEWSTVLQDELDTNVFNAPNKTAREAIDSVIGELDQILAAQQ